MIEFSPLYLLLLLFMGFFIPGIIFSLGLLKRKELPLFDKAGIGLGIGMVVPALIAFLLSFFGVLFSYPIALASIGIFYAIAIALFVKEKAWEQFSFPADPKLVVSSVALALLILLTFWIRIQTHSPVFMELDPYYYMFITHYIVTEGEVPLTDQTAWYPLETSHRSVPLKAYPEAIGYSLYTYGGEYNRYLLSDLAGSFPPVLAALAVFFFALFISSEYKREFGIIAAAVFSFIPMFLMKTLAGESEIQPYAFFALAFFFAMYALAVKRKDFTFAGLAALAFLACMAGSSSYVVIFAALIIFIPLQAVMLFFQKEPVLEFVKLNAVVAAGAVFASILTSSYSAGELSFSGLLGSTMLGLYGVLAFALALSMVREKVKDLEAATYALGGLVLVGIVVMAFTPIGGAITSLAGGTLGIATFTLPLHKTIAEQGVAGSEFQGTLGFSGMVFSGIPALLFAIPSAVMNFVMGTIVAFLNGLFGAGITYTEKDNSMLLLIYFMAILALSHSLYRKLKFNDLRLPLLFIAIIFPISVVGMLKTKYTIYLGFATAIAFGVVLGEIFDFAILRAKNLKEEAERKKWAQYAFMGLVIFGSLFAYSQAAMPPSIGKALLSNSMQERFAENPLGAQAKLRAVCAMYDPMGVSSDPVCLAARDPVGFANLGTNYQYHQTVCAYSIISNPSAPTEDERIAVQYRCMMRLDYYWIELMEWMENESPRDARFTSWWDYGHWTNFFGDRNTVLRNEHASHDMIVEVAHGFLYGTPDELRTFMLAHDSKYVFFDQEILGAIKPDGFMSFGGKYGALNYLSCSRNNQTGVGQNPGESLCEAEHLWESVYVPVGLQAQECAITSAKKGSVGYTVRSVGAQRSFVPTYCVGEVALADGTKALGTYYLDESKKSPNGDLKLNKARLNLDYEDSAQGFRLYTALYDRSRIWVENGVLVDGWEDRKGKFYDSNLYNGFVLGSLPGFDLVYQTSGGEIKVFRIRE